MSNLYHRLSKIGIRVFSSEIENMDTISADIEKTIVDALYEVDNDSRILGLLFSWTEIHGLHLIADKFVKYYNESIKFKGESPWVVAFAAKLVDQKDYRFKKILKKFDHKIWLNDFPMETALKMDGAILYLLPLNIFVPKGHIRIRHKDIQSKEELIKRNHQYANRFRYGSNWRSEIITEIENHGGTAYRIAKNLGLSYSRVSLVYNEFMLLKNSI